MAICRLHGGTDRLNPEREYDRDAEHRPIRAGDTGITRLDPTEFYATMNAPIRHSETRYTVQHIPIFR